MKPTEDSRVKIPTILHLSRLGYQYLSLKKAKWDKETNIFTEVFTESVLKINEGLSTEDVQQYYSDLSLDLENEDIGKVFYEKLVRQSGIRLIDFDDFDNNSFHVVTELTYKKDDDEFRPDVILLINGMPLVFIEVKIPNNKDGIIAERDRIYRRFQNKKFRKFVNLTQLMVFTNNMEYDDDDFEPIQGAYYATPSYDEPGLNYFREEDEGYQKRALPPIEEETENDVLRDNNLFSIKYANYFVTNKSPTSPTNRICTSLFSRERLAFLLRYAIANVKRRDKDEHITLEKHVMRYPQIFASYAIRKKLDEGVKKGIIWHTQGSGKTALAFYNVHILTDHYQSKGVIAKFYFIVDRLSLLTQASREFEARGLKVRKINSRDEFAIEIKSTLAIQNDSGHREITVVNIQKFKDDADVVRNTDYSLNIQRIYFLDEVHRSYNPSGSFLANLKESDPHSIKIGLTGTPLIGGDFKSKQLFGDYIHKYYYNLSIKDKYTLRLIREEIKTEYKLKLKQALEDIKILKGDVDKTAIFSDRKFAGPMLDFIVEDFENTRLRLGDPSIGGMVVCDSADQARELNAIFLEKYTAEVTISIHSESTVAKAADKSDLYVNQQKEERKVKSAALILYDAGSKKERELLVEQFKDGQIDLLFVYNMLLTGFDAKRLKKLYIGRVIKSHNLLQALTRVNRTYKNHRFGYVVDFADIQKEFDKTNKAYFDELKEELGDELQHYSDLFLNAEEVIEEVRIIKEAIFHYETENPEVFSQQISEIKDRETMLGIAKALNTVKSLYNLIRLSGQYDLLEKLDFKKLSLLSRLANNRLTLINQKKALESGVDTSHLLNVALEEVIFAFTKVGEGELVLADELKDILRRTREALGSNLDQQSPQFVSLREELERLFKKKNLSEVSKEEMTSNIKALNAIYAKVVEDQRKNKLLQAKYSNDAKYVRIHKRLLEKGDPTSSEALLFEALSDLKQAADEQILQNGRMLSNEAYIERMIGRQIILQFDKKHHIALESESTQFIKKLLVEEYINEYNGTAA